MRILVTGGAGFIGRHVVARLGEGGHEVRVLDSMRPDVHQVQEHDVAGLVRGDVRDAQVVAVEVARADVVCHLAAKVGLGVDVGDMPDYASSNVHGTSVLLAEMSRAGTKRLVLASSMVVYGAGLAHCATHGTVTPAQRRASDLAAGRFEAPCPQCGSATEAALVAEHAPTDPRNAYAVSKLAQEQLAAVWQRETGSALTALRFHNVYGPGMPANTPYAGVASIFASAIKNGQPPQVYEDGGQQRDFVHVSDVASAVVASIESRDGGMRTFNIGSGEQRTVGTLAQGLVDVLGGQPPHVTGKFRLGDVRHIVADSARARSELQWSPQVAFADGLREVAEFLAS